LTTHSPPTILSGVIACLPIIIGAVGFFIMLNGLMGEAIDDWLTNNGMVRPEEKNR